MRTPLSWLREMTPIDPSLAAGDIAASLSDLGLVVEAIERVGEGLGQVVVALVREISPIEGADRIRRVLVDAGGRELEIVCGAWNFSVGDLVPLAPVGAILPGGFEIGRRKMRGVVSEGMLCSGLELGLGNDGSGLLVLGGETGAPGAPALSLLVPGTPITDALGIVPDVVFELEIAPNRPDALSVAGVARDLAARLGLPFTLPSPRLTGITDSGQLASPLARVDVRSPELCTRMTGRVLTGVTVGASPPEVVRRLLLCGMRPINSVVDASNYVMLELGQPTHPYDLELLEGGISARAARGGERLVTLDGAERVLGERDCVIADGRDRAVGIGGIMGGADTEISAGTTAVLLEAAHFDPLSIARTAKRLGLRTEASVRFERGCDPEIAELAGARYCELIASAAAKAGVPAPSVVGELLDARPRPFRSVRVALRTGRVNAILGAELADDTIDSLLTPIGFGIERHEPGLAEVTVPSFRPDTTREIDVIEEVARHHGYSAIPIAPLRAPGVGTLTPHQRLRRRLHCLVTALGAHEAWTPTFVSPADHERAGLAGAEMRLANPLVSEESVLRKSLLPGLLLALRRNVVHRNPSLRLYEMGHVFELPRPDEVLPDEREVVGIALAREDDGAESAVRSWRLLAHGLGILDIVLEQTGLEGYPSMHPTRAARLVGGGAIGLVGEVDPAVIEAFGLPHARIGWIVADLERLLALAGRPGAVREPSRYPSSDIDLAFSVDEAVPADAVEAVLVVAAGELCESVHLFDVYRGPGVEPGRRSLAYRLRFCAADRTLTDAEVSDVRARCVTAVEHSFPAALRG